MALTWLVGFCLAGSWNGGVLEWREGDWRNFDWQDFTWWDYAWREDDWWDFSWQDLVWREIGSGGRMTGGFLPVRALFGGILHGGEMLCWRMTGGILNFFCG